MNDKQNPRQTGNTNVGDIKHQRERGGGVGLTSAAGLLLAKRKSFRGDEERYAISSLLSHSLFGCKYPAKQKACF